MIIFGEWMSDWIDGWMDGLADGRTDYLPSSVARHLKVWVGQSKIEANVPTKYS